MLKIFCLLINKLYNFIKFFKNEKKKDKFIYIILFSLYSGYNKGILNKVNLCFKCLFIKDK